MGSEMCIRDRVLNANSEKINHRDWCGLVGMLDDDAIASDVAAQFTELIHVVRVREAMHDKFWRYLELFKGVVNSDT